MITGLQCFWKYTYFAKSCLTKFLWMLTEISYQTKLSYFVYYFCKTVLGWVFDIWPKWLLKLWSYICNTLVTDNLQNVIYKPEWCVYSYCRKPGIKEKYSDMGKQNQNSKAHLSISITTFGHDNKGGYSLWYWMLLSDDIKQKIHDIFIINLNTSFNMSNQNISMLLIFSKRSIHENDWKRYWAYFKGKGWFVIA